MFWKGPPFEILKAWQEQRFRLAISLPILEEYRRVLDEFAKEQQMPVLNSVLKVIELRSGKILIQTRILPKTNSRGRVHQ